MGKIHQPYNKFKGWLKENQLTYADIANVLGNTTATISAKINGQSDFLLCEIVILKEKYQIGTEIFLQ